MALGAIEAGGTKVVCAVRDEDGHERARARVPTTTPEATVAEVARFFGPHRVRAVGLASFGPLELDRRAGQRYGALLATPKPGWSDFALRASLELALGAVVHVETDVNAAALAEHGLGAGRGADPLVYVTVGTGVGGGAVVRGVALHGLVHPEMGHVPMPRLALPDGTLDPFDGACPFHRRCLEGLVSGPAIAQRTGTHAHELGDDDPVWELVAGYLALGMATLTLVLSPERIVMGGGVMRRARLLERVRVALRRSLAGYVPRDVIATDDFLVAPALGEDAGLEGAFLIASRG